MGDAPNILLCVGATKAGTTWLHDQLAAHPECYLRTIKEYHYFSTNADAQWTKMITDTQMEIDELAALPADDFSPFEAQRLDDLRSWLPMITPRHIDPAAFAAYLHRSAPATAKLVGDFTPAYSVISGKLLEPAARLPRLKVLYLIREPLARLWSHVRMIADRMDPDRFDIVAPAMLRRVVQGEEDGGIRSIVRRGDYLGNLPKLQRLFGNRLMVMFTEDLFTKAGFDRVLAFLGLAPAVADMAKRVHEGRALPLPADLRRAAVTFLRPQYAYIAAEFANLPAAWQENMAQFIPMPQTTKAVI